MIAPCEGAVKFYLPAMKCAIARALYKKHGIKQEKIARMLGITQAQVSKYLSHKTSDDIEKTINEPRVIKDATIIANKIKAGTATDSAVSKIVCKRCASLFSHKGCDFSQAF